jgi:hypothetical protein
VGIVVSEGTEASGETVAYRETAVMKEIVAFAAFAAFVASEAFVVCQGTEASERETQVAELVARSVPARPAGSSI